MDADLKELTSTAERMQSGENLESEKEKSLPNAEEERPTARRNQPQVVSKYKDTISEPATSRERKDLQKFKQQLRNTEKTFEDELELHYGVKPFKCVCTSNAHVGDTGQMEELNKIRNSHTLQLGELHVENDHLKNRVTELMNEIKELKGLRTEAEELKVSYQDAEYLTQMLEERNKRLGETLEDLGRQVEIKNKEISNLQTTEAQLRKQLETRGNAEKERVKLENELINCKALLKKLSQELKVEATNENMKQMESQLYEFRRKSKVLERQLEEKKDQHKIQMDKIQRTKNRHIETLKNEIAELKVKIRDMCACPTDGDQRKAKICSLQEENINLKAAFRKVEDERDGLRWELEVCSKERDKYRGQRCFYQDEREKTNVELESAMRDRSAYENKIRKLHHEKTDLVQKVMNHEREIENLKEELCHYCCQVDRLETSTKDFEHERNNLKEKLKKSCYEMNRMKIYITELEEQKELWKRKLNKRSDEKRDLKAQLAQNFDEIDQLKSELCRYCCDNERLESKASSLQEQNENLESKICQLCCENKQLKVQISNLVKEKNSLETTLQSCRDTLQTFQEQIQNCQERGKELKQQMCGACCECQRLKMELGQVQEERSSLEKCLQQALAEAEELKSMLKSDKGTKTQVEAFKDELRSLEQQMEAKLETKHKTLKDFREELYQIRMYACQNAETLVREKEELKATLTAQKRTEEEKRKEIEAKFSEYKIRMQKVELEFESRIEKIMSYATKLEASIDENRKKATVQIQNLENEKQNLKDILSAENSNLRNKIHELNDQLNHAVQGLEETLQQKEKLTSEMVKHKDELTEKIKLEVEMKALRKQLEAQEQIAVKYAEEAEVLEEKNARLLADTNSYEQKLKHMSDLQESLGVLCGRFKETDTHIADLESENYSLKCQLEKTKHIAEKNKQLHQELETLREQILTNVAEKAALIASQSERERLEAMIKELGCLLRDKNHLIDKLTKENSHFEEELASQSDIRTVHTKLQEVTGKYYGLQKERDYLMKKLEESSKGPEFFNFQYKGYETINLQSNDPQTLLENLDKALGPYGREKTRYSNLRCSVKDSK